MTTAYYTSILFDKSEIDELNTALESNSLPDGWENEKWVTNNVFSGRFKIDEALSTIKYLLTLRVGTDGGSKLENSYTTICVYTNLDKAIAVQTIYNHISDQLTAQKGNSTSGNYLNGFGLYTDSNISSNTCTFWSRYPFAEKANNTANPALKYTGDYTSAAAVRFFTNVNYVTKGTTISAEAKQKSDPEAYLFTYGPKLNNNSDTRRFTNKTRLIMGLLENSPFDKTYYIDPNIKILSEGVHNYLFKLLDTYSFVFSPKVTGDRLKKDDLIDGFTNDIVGFNKNFFNNDTGDTLKTAMFNSIKTVVKTFKTFDMNEDSKRVRKSLTRLYYFLLDLKLGDRLDSSDNPLHKLEPFYMLNNSLILDQEESNSIKNNSVSARQNIITATVNKTTRDNCYDDIKYAIHKTSNFIDPTEDKILTARLTTKN